MVNLEDIQSHLPTYLSPEQQRDLLEELRDFENRSYYTRRYENEILQGDGWTKIAILDFESGNRDKIKGILLSNSCDIDLGNRRELPPRVVFAPLVSLQAFSRVLKDSYLNADQIRSKIESIRKQRVTSLFYLPKGGQLDEEHIAILDDLHSVPLQSFIKEPGRVKLFTLGQMGFYLFLLKLSIHFCRFNEGIVRS